MKKVHRISIVAAVLIPIFVLSLNFVEFDEATPAAPAASGRIKKEQEVSISFAALKKGFYNKIKESLEEEFLYENCDEVGTSSDKRPKDEQYKCNEIPYGDIISDSAKLIMNVEFDGKKGKNYKFEKKDFPLYMSRHQTYGKVKVDMLDRKADTLVEVDKKLFNNVYFEQHPKGGELLTRACMLIPGVKIYSKKQTIDGDLKKKFLFWTMKADADIHVDLGSFSFESAKVCGDIITKVVNGQKVVVSLDKESTKVSFVGLKRSGLKVDTKVSGGWLVKIVFKVIDFFGPNIQKQIEQSITKQTKKAINAKMPKLSSKDFKSGKWLESYANFRYSINLFNTHVAKNVNSDYLNLKPSLGAACLKQVGGMKNFSDVEKRDATLLCSHISRLDVQLFVKDSESNQKECYSHAIGLGTPTKDLPWWGSQCFINAKLIMEYPKSFDGYYTCLAAKMKSKTLSDTSCQTELEALFKSHRISSLGRSVNRVMGYARIFKDWDTAVEFSGLLWGYKDDKLPKFVADYEAPKPLSNAKELKLKDIKGHGKKNLRVLTYNIQGLPKPIVTAPDWRFEEIGRQLNARLKAGTAPDVVMFQEMVTSASEKIIKFAEYPYVYFGAPRRLEGELRVGLLGGDVIMSRYPIAEAEYLEFGPKRCLGTDCTANKAWLVARIQVPGVPHLVEVVNVHMQSEPGLVGSFSEAELVKVQNKQTDLLADFMEKLGTYGKLPIIYAADFNFKPALDSYDYFKKAMKVKDAGYLCVKEASCKVLNKTKDDALWKLFVDHHFIRSSKAIDLQVTSAQKNFNEPVDGVELSDHSGLEMTYQLSW